VLRQSVVHIDIYLLCLKFWHYEFAAQVSLAKYIRPKEGISIQFQFNTGMDLGGGGGGCTPPKKSLKCCKFVKFMHIFAILSDFAC